MADDQATITSSSDPFDPNSLRAPGIMGADGQAASSAVSGSSPGKEVKLIVFDMGHVFVDFDWEEVCRGFMAKSGRSRDEFRGVLAHVGSLGYERGLISTPDFLKELNQQLGTSLTLDEFKTLWNATFHENPAMAALLQSLKARLPLYLLSNTNEVHYEHLQSSYNVARHFQELILSFQVGCSKPDLRIYREVLTRSSLPAENCLFIDDLEHNIKAAQAVGMQAIKFTGIDDLKAGLASLGITV